MSILTAKPYYQYFKNIKQKAMEVVSELSSGLWGYDQETGLWKLNTMGLRLSRIYNISTISSLELGTREVYYIQAERIELPRVSLVSFLHEYRHHMQKYGKQHYRDVEEDARGWSISLFAQALPDIFDNAWRNQKIWYLPPYSANWRQEIELNAMV